MLCRMVLILHPDVGRLSKQHQRERGHKESEIGEVGGCCRQCFRDSKDIK